MTTSSAAPTNDRLTWGVVGSRNFPGTLSGDSGEEGVIRIVEAGVSYAPLPSEAGLREWQRVPGNSQRFEMAWSGNPASVQSLEVFRQKLTENPPRSADDSRLNELDEVVSSLLRITKILHKSRGLGLLSPYNILLLPGKGGKELLLADLGFTWKSGPFKPAWLEGGSFKDLWDSAPEVQQYGGAPRDPASDIRTLARLFAYLMTGTVRREILDAPPETSIRQAPNPAVFAEIWKMLSSACRGAVSTVEEFEEKLRGFRLSQHLVAAPLTSGSPEPQVTTLPASKQKETAPTASPRKKSYALAAVGAVVLIVLLVGLLAWQPWSNSPTGFTGGSAAKPSAIFALKDKYLAASPEEQSRILWEMYQAELLSADAALRAKEEACREELRRAFLAKNWIPRFRKAEEISLDLPQRFVSAQKVDALHNELKLLQARPPVDPTADAEEKQCLAFSEMRSRELGAVP